MIKFRLYFDKDKETEWLNQMAKEGYAMSGFFAGFYSFEKCEPGKYTYQIDFGDKLYSVSEDYRDFMKENNIEIVQLWGYWIILRKLTSDGDFKLYTDVDSNIAHYTKIRNMFKAVTILELICFMIECICAPYNSYAIIFAIIIGLLVIAMMKATLHTNKVITALKERKGEINERCSGKVSPLLAIGMLLSTIALVIKDYEGVYMSDFTRGFGLGLQIVAIVAMLFGLYLSRNVFKNN